MKKLEQQFKEATKSVRLTDDEKLLMKKHVVEYMEYKPIRVHEALGAQDYSSLPFFSFFKAHHLSGALIIALMVTTSSFGVSFAADDALPGDLLYGVKVNINEEIKTALISEKDTKSRVAWEQERAELRLVEASQLAAEGRLDSEKQEQVSKLFTEHTEAIVEQVIAVEDDDPVFAAEASSALEDSLDTHEAVLARLIVEQGEGVEEGARGLVSQVRTVAMEVEKIREDAEVKMAINEAEPTLVQAGEQKLSQDTEVNLAESANMRERATYRAKDRATELFTKAQELQLSLEKNSELSLQAQAQITFGKSLLDGGAKALEANNLGDAYGKYRKASASFQKVIQLLEVARLFSIEIYPDLEDVEIIDAADDTSKEKMPEARTEEVEQARVEAQEAVENARKLLLTQEGFEPSDVEKASKHIKDASALILRGEIATALKSNDDAKKLYKQAFTISTETIALLETATEDGSVHQVDVPVHVEDQLQEKKIFLHHEFKEGKHIYSGTIQTPTPCFTVQATAKVSESLPEKITIELTQIAPESDVCIQTLAEKEFSVEVIASEQAVVAGVRVNATETEWEEISPLLQTEEKSSSTFETKASDAVKGLLKRAF